MATARQTAANRANAAHSTGPRTPAGKEAAKVNRLTHGLDSPAPVVPGEDPAAWAAHRAGIVQSLAPVGPLEAELADRAALLFWRLRRVGRYETATATAALDHAVGTLTHELAGLRDRLDQQRAELDQLSARAALVRDLPDLPADHRLPAPTPGLLLVDVCEDECLGTNFALELLQDVPLPDEAWDDLAGWDGWTAGAVRAALAEIGTAAERTPAQVFARAGRRLAREVADQQDAVTRAEDALARAEADLGAAADQTRERNVFPTAATDQVIRYEAHLSRQLTQTLQLLDRYRAARVAGRLRPVEPGGWDPGPVSSGGRADETADRTQPGAAASVAGAAGASIPAGERADSADRTQPAAESRPVVAAEGPSPARNAADSADRTHLLSELPLTAADREAIAAHRADFIRQMARMNRPGRPGGPSR